MTAKRPADGTYLAEHAQSQECIEKTFNIQNEAINFLVPHIRKIVETSYRENLGDPAQRAAMDCKEWEELANTSPAEYSEEEMDDEEKEFCANVFDAIKKSGGITPEKMMEINKGVDEELIEENSQMAASYIWEMIVYAGEQFFEKTGPQSIDVQAFLAGLDLAECLTDMIPEKYYPEIKITLALYMPQIFKKSFIGRVREKYMEMFLQESSGQIVLREVSWEMLQTWAHS